MQKSKRCFCYFCSTINKLSTNSFCYPSRISTKNIIISPSSQMSNQSKFHHKMVNKFLSLFLIYQSRFQIFFYINIQKRRNITKRHCCSVLFFDSRKICKIYKLHSLLWCSSWFRYIYSIKISHYFYIFQCLNLHRNFLSKSYFFISHISANIFLIFFFCSNKIISTIQCQPSIITNNSSSSIVIWQPCNYMIRTIFSYFCIISRKNRIIMIFCVVKNFSNFWINFKSFFFYCIFHNSITTKWFHSSF